MFYLRIIFFLPIFAITKGNERFVIKNPVPLTNETDSNFEPKYNYYGETCGIKNGYNYNRIVGGYTALRGEFPWLVSLQTEYDGSYRHLCGGSVVNRYWVLTAGHCVGDINPYSLYVVAGDHNLYQIEGYEQRRQIVEARTPYFDITNFQNDIALLRMHAPLQFNRYTMPICLPQAEDYFYGYATVAGWGKLSENSFPPETLQHVELPILNKAFCDYQYKKVGYAGFLNTCQLCAGYINGGRDSCQGDSGGPLMCKKNDGRYYLCGIVSWGIGCARASNPGIYTKVTCYVRWIQGIVNRV